MSNKSSIIVGKKYGDLIVLNTNSSHYFENSGRKLWKTSVQCLCGNIFEIKNFNLTRNNNTKKCENCANSYEALIKTVKIGDKFDNLIIIGFTREYSNNENGRLLAICECICGNKKTKRIDNLKSTIIHSCGCKPPAHCVKIGGIYRSYFNEIKANAANRGITFNVTMNDLWAIYEQQNGKCALSGIDIGFAKMAKLPSTASLDRIDSSKDYSINNIQWVHKDINKMKMDLNQDRFIELSKLIAKNN